MKKYLFIIILIFCFINVCSSQTDEKDKFSEIISSNINENDSIHIEIKYREQIGSIGYYGGKILIKVKEEKLYFGHISSNPKRKFEHFQTTPKNILELVRDFEINGKKSKKRPCGTILSEQHGFEISLRINDKKTEFTFCKFEYDGLDILLLKLVSLKEKN